MRSHQRLGAWLWIGLFAGTRLAVAQVQDREVLKREGSDRPKVAIIQYESGRTLVAREVDGQLQVVDVSGRPAEIIARNLDTSAVLGASDDPASRRPSEAASGDHELFFNPAWYSDHAVINVTPPEDATPEGRATERYKQNAAELQAQVRSRRNEQGTQGLTNSAGQAYPLTAAEALEADRLARLQGQISGDPYTTFYSLGGGLEYYRQRELAARKELTLLSFDALLEEGVAFFRAGRYGEAARSFLAATQKDHGDAGSRLYAAQSLMAVGMYSQALDHVRRAEELAPQLLHRPLNHRSQYVRPEDFDRQLLALREHVGRHPDDADAVLLLAYEQFFSDRPGLATEPMRRVKDLANRDHFAKRLYDAARPMLTDR